MHCSVFMRFILAALWPLCLLMYITFMPFLNTSTLHFHRGPAFRAAVCVPFQMSGEAWPMAFYFKYIEVES